MSENRTPSQTEIQATALLGDAPILENEYFRRLENGTLPKEGFAHSQVQFSYAVGFFSRNLATLIARLPTSAGRAILVHNLAEEHGLDEDNMAAGFRGHLAHDQTFARFLDSLGVSAEQQLASIPEAPVTAFNLALLGACGSQAPSFALAGLGMIEYAFADISALIGRRVVELGWVNADELVHYSLHAAIDKRHAAELFEAAEAAVLPGEPSFSISSGLEFGRYIFEQLYQHLIDFHS